jgi:hypothetical protein
LGHRELLWTKSIRREITGEDALGAEYCVQIGSGGAQLDASLAKESSALPRLAARLVDAVMVYFFRAFAVSLFAAV